MVSRDNKLQNTIKNKGQNEKKRRQRNGRQNDLAEENVNNPVEKGT